MIMRSGVVIQQLLAAHSGFGTLPDCLRIHFRCYCFDDALGVILRLQQPRYVIYRVAGNSDGLLLEPNELIQGEIVVLGPPSWLPGLPGQVHEIARSRLVNSVE